MLGIALEGGGARGAYHIGVVRAYLESGYAFDGFVGTSIGAVNAAVLAQGDFEKALKLWPELSMERIFDADESRLIKIGESKWDMRILNNVRSSIGKIIDGGGIDTSKIKNFFSECIDERRLRDSGKDYGLVTVSITERKPYELYIGDIPQGKLLGYIMASACFPGFKSEIIDGSAYIDGGLYNNCPINMLVRKGYDEIIAVRTRAPGIYRRVRIPDGVSLKVIEPGEDLGNIMLFSPERTERSMKLGYFDGLRALRGLNGRDYYLEPIAHDEIFTRLMALEERTILEAGRLLGISGIPVRRMLLEYVIPRLGTYLKLDKDFSYADFVVALLEPAANAAGLERYDIYDFQQFVSEIRQLAASAARVKSQMRGRIPPLRSDAAARLLLRDILNQN